MDHNILKTVFSFLENEKESQLIRLVLNLIISAVASVFLYKIMPRFRDTFIKADLKGVDMSKREKYTM